MPHAKGSPNREGKTRGSTGWVIRADKPKQKQRHHVPKPPAAPNNIPFMIYATVPEDSCEEHSAFSGWSDKRLLCYMDKNRRAPRRQRKSKVTTMKRGREVPLPSDSMMAVRSTKWSDVRAPAVLARSPPRQAVRNRPMSWNRDKAICNRRDNAYVKPPMEDDIPSLCRSTTTSPSSTSQTTSPSHTSQTSDTSSFAVSDITDPALWSKHSPHTSLTMSPLATTRKIPPMETPSPSRVPCRWFCTNKAVPDSPLTNPNCLSSQYSHANDVQTHENDCAPSSSSGTGDHEHHLRKQNISQDANESSVMDATSSPKYGPLDNGTSRNASTDQQTPDTSYLSYDFLLLNVAAIVIQTETRRFLGNRKASIRMWSIVTIQAHWRRFMAQTRFLRQWLAIVTIQSFWRYHRKFVVGECQEPLSYAHENPDTLAPKDFENAATKIQSAFRGWWARDNLSIDTYCATQIQRIARGFLGRFELSYRLYCVLLLQSTARMHFAKRRYEEKLFEKWIGEYDSAVKIQTTWRGYYARELYQWQLVLIMLLQASVRRFLARNEYEKKRWDFFHDSAIKIQSAWRSHVSRKKLDFMLWNVVVVQSVARRWIARKLFHQIKEMRMNNEPLDNPTVFAQRRAVYRTQQTDHPFDESPTSILTSKEYISKTHNMTQRQRLATGIILHRERLRREVKYSVS